uniref:Transposase n=1 Tax=Heterorhabditis bacteriophora TaxID=37862 RepID=A0A1I7XB46_HETBA
MYFNGKKKRPLGFRLEGGKLQRKISKSLEQLRRHDPDVEISDEPTQHLFVSNSSILCGVSVDELECIFRPFDDDCSFTVYPNKRLDRKRNIYRSVMVKTHSLKHRTVIHYGYEFDYDTNSAFRTSDAIPPVIDRLIDKIMENGYAKFRPDQVR